MCATILTSQLSRLRADILSRSQLSQLLRLSASRLCGADFLLRLSRLSEAQVGLALKIRQIECGKKGQIFDPFGNFW